MKRLFVLATAALFSLACLVAPANAGDKKKKKNAETPEATFKKLDTNSDGKLSKEEFVKIAEQNAKGKVKKKGPTPEEMFAKLDADKDGSVSLEEFKKIGEVSAKKKKKENK